MPGADQLQPARHAGDAGIVDVHAALAGALAIVLDAPVRAVADATGLANDQIGGSEAGIEQFDIVFEAAIVVRKLGATALDERAVSGDVAAAPADAQHALIKQTDRHRGAFAGLRRRARWRRHR